MDVISFIPGVGPTAAFSPGVNTPAPYNVNHTGGTDGTTPQTATSNVAEIYNRILLMLAAAVDYSGIGIDHANWAQLGPAIRAIAQSVVNGALAGGVVTTAQYNNDFTNSLGSTGYQFLKGGMILQWGVTSTPTSSFPAFFTTTFPLSFPNQVFQVFGTMQNLATLNTSLNVHETEARLSAKTQSNATWLHDFVGDLGFGSGGTQYPQVFWLALGR